MRKQNVFEIDKKYQTEARLGRIEKNISQLEQNEIDKQETHDMLVFGSMMLGAGIIIGLMIYSLLVNAI